MRNIILSLLILASPGFLKAGDPIKFKLGIMALPATTWLISSNYDPPGSSDVETKPLFTMSTNLGGVASVYFADRIGVELDAIFGKFSQDFKTDYSIPDETEEWGVDLSKTDIALLFKLGKLFYLEAGPQYTMISKVEHIYADGDLDYTDFYGTSQIYGIIGSGVSVSIPKVVQLEAGLRLGYGINDLNGDPAPYSSALHSAFLGFKIMVVHKF